MGIVSKPDTQRDLSLIADYLLRDENKAGREKWIYSITELGIKYAREEDGKMYPLTPARIHQILNRNDIPKHRLSPKKTVSKRKKKLS